MHSTLLVASFLSIFNFAVASKSFYILNITAAHFKVQNWLIVSLSQFLFQPRGSSLGRHSRALLSERWLCLKKLKMQPILSRRVSLAMPRKPPFQEYPMSLPAEYRFLPSTLPPLASLPWHSPWSNLLPPARSPTMILQSFKTKRMFTRLQKLRYVLLEAIWPSRRQSSS